MPWSIVPNSASCPASKPFAVVQKSNGKTVGCHPTKAKAQAQLAALNINVKGAEMPGRADDPNDTVMCPNCSAMNAPDAVYCDMCGVAMGADGGGAPYEADATDTTKCPNCGKMNDSSAQYCDQCGASMPMRSALPSENLFRAVYPGVEVRDQADGQPILAGHFARFNEWTEIDSMFEGRFMERIAPGAFTDSFANSTPKALFQHGRDPEVGDKVLGSPVSVREDDLGAAYEVPLFPSVPPLIVDGLRAGAYGASFRFSVVSDDVVRKPARSDHNPEGISERTITEARVAEFGPVTFPAYAGATAGIRSITDDFRPRDRNEEIAQMAREHPQELAQVIQKALKGSEPEPPKPKAPVQPRFRSREEYLQWLSKS